MNRSRYILLVPLALIGVLLFGAAVAAPPAKSEQPWDAAPTTNPGAQWNRGGQWGEHFQGSGNVTNSRCQGMSRGANCITPTSRKDAARRAAAAREAAKSDTNATAPVTKGNGGHKK
jgi:hypothetical protein